MICPKCRKGSLETYGRFKWECSFYPEGQKACGFACGLGFFFDDDNLSIKVEIGIPIEGLTLSARAKELIRTKVLALDDLKMDVEMDKISVVKNIEDREKELEECEVMMREVVGKSAEIYRQLSSGDYYRKYRNGGLIGKSLGRGNYTSRRKDW